MITRDDYDWWLKTAATVEWTWAKTYAETAPHDYIVEGRTRGLDHGDFVRAARVIHTFGQPGKYYGITNIYLEDPDTGVKWWTMDDVVTETNLINRATTDRLYGVQNAPMTCSGIVTKYDAVATSYDTDNPISDSITAQIKESLRESAGPYPPAVLDVACGTGRALDLGITPPDRYAGVDPSAPMLNQLVRKHPKVARLYPTTIEHALSERLFTPGQFEFVTLITNGKDNFAHETISELATLASRAFIFANSDEVRVLRA